jgi:hypothetical protein
VTPEALQRLERARTEANRPTLVLRPYDPATDWSRPKGVSVEEWIARKEAKTQASLQKLKSCVPKSKRYGALPADFKTRPYRWDPRKGKFIPNGEAPARRESGLILNGRTPKAPREAKPKAPVDDLGVRVASIPLGAKFKAFAQANGVWQDRYDALNPGLQRMNVVNRLRAAVKKNAVIKWPKGA